MKKRVFLAVLGVIFISAVFSAHDVIEFGGTVVTNTAIFGDTKVGGGVNLAYFPAIYKSFGIGIFQNLGYGADGSVFDLLAGPYYAFKIGKKIFLPVSAGVYLGIIFIGYGGNVTVQYELTPHLSLFVRFQCAYAYYFSSGVRTSESLVMSPSVGMGIRF